MATYYYRVTAVFDGLESELSTLVSATLSTTVTYPDFSPQNWLETSDYIKLLTSQYQLADTFKSWLQHCVEIFEDGMECSNQLNNDFDLNFALGSQLDIIGDIVGQKRTLPFEPSDGSNPVLDDYVYRQLIKAKIALNHWDGQLLSIEEKWNSIFPNTQIIIVDNQDMSIDVSVSGEISSLIQDMITQDMIIPRPQGVQINCLWAQTKYKAFCYDMETLEYAGYDEGYWKQEI
jgi:hypothetical protein